MPRHKRVCGIEKIDGNENEQVKNDANLERFDFLWKVLGNHSFVGRYETWFTR